MDIKSKHLQAGLVKLKEEQDKGLQLCLENISKWSKFREDYEALKNKLDAISDKVGYDIMVPFGSVAFMPGKLIHTNEIMVLLGDNWFAERSSKQASEIVARRIAQCDTALKQFEIERNQFEQWMLSTSKVQEEIGGNLLDIVEECKEDEELAWKERHRENVRKHHEKKNMMKGNSAEESQENIEDYWTRLEMNEAKYDEFSELKATENPEMEVDISSDEDEDSIISSSEEDNEKELDVSQVQTKKNKAVRWVNEPLMLESKPTSNTSKDHDITSLEAFASEPIIQSPSDIYKHFATPSESNPSLKSILKPPSTFKHPAAEPAILKPEPSTSQIFKNQNENKAFSGIIVERETIDCNVSLGQSTSVKKVSKFKAQRQAKKL